MGMRKAHGEYVERDDSSLMGGPTSTKTSLTTRSETLRGTLAPSRLSTRDVAGQQAEIFSDAFGPEARPTLPMNRVRPEHRKMVSLQNHLVKAIAWYNRLPG